MFNGNCADPIVRPHGPLARARAWVSPFDPAWILCLCGPFRPGLPLLVSISVRGTMVVSLFRVWECGEGPKHEHKQVDLPLQPNFSFYESKMKKSQQEQYRIAMTKPDLL